MKDGSWLRGCVVTFFTPIMQVWVAPNRGFPPNGHSIKKKTLSGMGWGGVGWGGVGWGGAVRSGWVGSGRVGSGGVGSGRVGSGRAGPFGSCFLVSSFIRSSSEVLSMAYVCAWCDIYE